MKIVTSTTAILSCGEATAPTTHHAAGRAAAARASYAMAAIFAARRRPGGLSVHALSDDAKERTGRDPRGGAHRHLGLAFFMRNIAVIALGTFKPASSAHVSNPGRQRVGGLIVTTTACSPRRRIVMILALLTSCTGRYGERRSTRSASRAQSEAIRASIRGASNTLRSASRPRRRRRRPPSSRDLAISLPDSGGC